MALNDKSVITAAVGYVFTAPIGTAAPSPTELESVDPATFGAQVQTLTLTGTATAGTFTLTSGTATAPLPYNATAAQVQAALEALPSIGVGNVIATGTLSTGIKINIVGKLQGQALAAITVAASLTGTTPVLAVVITKAPNGWSNIGHTSRGDMPEFGFDGGDAEVRGTWQNQALREVVTEQAADYLTLFLHQFDTASFELYYGANSSATPGVFGVSGATQVNERAFLVIIVDGETKVGFYSPKASVRRDDAIQLPSDEFASLPIRATFLKHAANDLFQWISADLFD
ncbi:phage tail tube protein [Nocardia sp. NPDC055002]